MKNQVPHFGLITVKISAFLVLSLFSRDLFGLDLPENQYQQIYNIINEADKEYSKGRKGSADKAYLQAREMLEEIKREFPDWDPTLISYRLEYITEKISNPEIKEKFKKEDEANKNTLDEELKIIKIIEIGISPRFEMPFDEKGVLGLLPIKKGQKFDPLIIEACKRAILETGQFRSVQVITNEMQTGIGGKGLGVSFIVEQNISQEDMDAYYEKSRRSENLTPKKTWWGKYCYANQDGIEIIPAEFEEAYPFENEYACVKQNGKYGLINAYGEFVLPALFKERIQADKPQFIALILLRAFEVSSWFSAKYSQWSKGRNNHE